MSALQQHARQTHIILVALCLLTLGTRVAFAFITPIDAAHDEWDHIATNLARDQGYVSSWPKTFIQPAYLNIPNYQFPVIPTATRVPVPVLYFALLYRLFGLNDCSLVIGQWILDTLTCLVLFALAQKVLRDRRVAILTSAAWALYPPALSLYNSRFSEPMTTLLLACLVYLLVWSQETHQDRRYALAGMLRRYEDLVTEPRHTMKCIYDFVGRRFPGERITAEVHRESLGKGRTLHLSAEID